MDPHTDDWDRISGSNGSRAESAPAVPDFVAARSLKHQLLAELRSSWEEGEPISPEDLLKRWSADSEARITPHSALGPDSCGRTNPPGSRLLALPSVGDELLGFHLCQELGRGSFARVFRAEQETLAGRPVVVKVSAIDGDEPRTLAQLQHTHIVPIYSLHEDRAAGIRVVCMPCFGGASLARVLQALGAETGSPAHGKELVAALAALRNPWPAAEEAAEARDRGPGALLRRLSYVDAAAWIIARLAEALQHAHQRGILHRDIKPSNILLCADGQPMLLDFNLAENFQADRALAAATLGGTVAYMAPEHLQALARRDPELVRQVDHRADLYGLGMVLYEMLAGRSPFASNPTGPALPASMEALAVERAGRVPSLRRHRPDIPWSLESITRKCLDPDPAKRYQQAEHLAEDLRRHLEDRSLKYAPELSWRERVRKWRRRHPRWTANGSIAVVATILLAVGTIVVPSALLQLHKRDREAAQQTKQSFLDYAQLTRCYLNATIGERSLLPDGIRFCEDALRHYDILQRKDWQKQAIWQWLGQEEQKEVAEEIRVLLLLLARARVRTALMEVGQAPPSLSAAAPAVLGWGAWPANSLALGASALTEASAPLARARALGDPGTVPAVWNDPPVTIEQLKQALLLKPRHYWPRFQLGMCYRQQGNCALAAIEFRACTVLSPEFSWGHFNLGESLHQLGKRLDAIEAYTAAIKGTPEIAQAYFNRGLVHLDLGNWQEALADFDNASEGGYGEDALYGGRGIALVHLGRENEAKAAFEKAWASGQQNPDMLLSYAFLISQRQPNEARKIFTKVLEQDQHNARACYGQGMLLENQTPDSEKAVGWFDQAIRLRPTFVEARLARAVIRARQGRGDQRREDVDLCVWLDPTGRTLYGAACFYALLADKSSEPLAASWREQALQLLSEAFQQGYGREKAATDSDLDGIRQQPKFCLLLERTRR